MVGDPVPLWVLTLGGPGIISKRIRSGRVVVCEFRSGDVAEAEIGGGI
jgi:hypothetical protein